MSERLVSAEEARVLREAATPGPWTLTACDGPWGSDVVHVGDDRAICGELPQNRADARLIAAAPDLAATVEALHAEVADLRRQLAEARAEAYARVDAERGAVVAWLVQRAPEQGAVEDVWWHIADAVSGNVHRATP